ncbi:hypothetical protein GA0004736_3379 [Curtobacterium sp. 9128]|nr:hypothetical protein [Curtobacterium sp. 9128]SBN64419.1 hypothetical protein GA0004736_3379 [Curtobacterium sp. 9128]
MTGHGVMCACTVHAADDLDDELAGKAIARAAEPDLPDTCD